MKITIRKRTISAVLALIMAFTAFSFSVGAADGPVMTQPSGTWYTFGGVSSYQPLENELKIYTTAAQKSAVISVSFPTEGGIRIHNESEGFFKPSSLKNISYQKTDTAIVMTVDGVKKAAFNFGYTEWSIDVYDADGNVAFSLSSSDISVVYADGAYTMAKLTGTISDGEIFTGLGERYSGVVLNGKSYKLWNTDCWSKGTDSYVNVPLLHSTNGYSLFFNSSYGAVADIGATDLGKYSLSFNGPDLDFYIWTDTPIENIKSYTSLTGKPFTAPKWAFRYWAGGTGTYWTNDADTAKSLLTDVLEGYKSLGTMPSAIYGEGVPMKDPVCIRLSNSYSVKMLGWNTPATKWDGAEFNLATLRALCPGVSDALLPGIRKKTDTSAFYSNATDREWIWGDYSNPNAVTMIKNKMNKYWMWGVQGAMVDYGEYVYDDTYFYNGMYGDEMHNLYAYYYNKATNEAWKNSSTGDDFILFARAGCAGSQQYAANFGGDQECTFDGLKQAIMGGISISASGFSVWGSDLGGLHPYGNVQGVPTEELYNRWLQFSALSPLMRAHGYNRNPWYYGNEATNTAFKKYYWLRENLLDTIYSANIASGKYGTPMMQSMQITFPDSDKLKTVEDQYMFCNDLLVCPVYSEGATSREVTFPEGIWYDLFTGEKMMGDATKTVEALIDEIPVYIASGAVLPITLSDTTLKLTDSISGTGRAALLITPPTEKKSAEFFTDEETAPTTYTVAPVSGNSFNINSDGSNQSNLMVVYGTSAASVICDGAELSKLSSMPTDSTVSGYYVDTASGCTYIALPSNEWQSVTVTDSSLESFNQQISIADGQTVGDVYSNIFSFSYNHETRYKGNIAPDACFHSLAGFLLERQQYSAINEPWFANEYFSRTASVSPKDSDGSVMLVKNFNLKTSFRVGLNAQSPNGAVFIGFRQNEPGHFFDHYCLFNQNQSFLRLTNTGITVRGGSDVPSGYQAVNKEDISFDIASNAGDLNGDGAVNIVDLVKLKKNIASMTAYSESADLNGDYDNTAEDIALLRKRLLGIPGIRELKELISTADSYVTVKLSVVGDTCTVTLCNGRNEAEELFTYTAKLSQDAPDIGYLAIGIGDTISYSIKSVELNKLP